MCVAVNKGQKAFILRALFVAMMRKGKATN